MEILLPKSIDDGRLDWVLALLERARSSSKVDIRLNWEKVGDVSPAGMAILCCVFDSFVEQGNSVKCVSVPRRFQRIPAVRNLIDIRKFRFLPRPDINSFEGDGTILRGATTLDVLFSERFREKFVDLLQEDIAYDCLLILNELMQNTVHHSTAERYYVYAGTWRDEFHAGVLDMGITIPAKMEQRYDRCTDLEYLELALREGITTRRARAGGVGLAYFFHFLKQNEGKLTIMSRGAQVRRYFKTRRTQRGELKFPLRGTWCFARFRIEEKT